jgi:hypothetical protein
MITQWCNSDHNPVGTGGVTWQTRTRPSELLALRSGHLRQQTKYRLRHGMIVCSTWKNCKSRILKKFPYLAAKPITEKLSDSDTEVHR